MILVYDITRGERTEIAVLLCDRHATNRRALGWSLGQGYESTNRVVTCDDCIESSEPTILDRVIEAGDRERDAGEPEPVKVLPGQRGWSF